MPCRVLAGCAEGSAPGAASLPVRGSIRRLVAGGWLRVDEELAVTLIHATARGAVLTWLSLPEDRMPEKIRLVGLEEHVALPELLDARARAGVPRIPQLGYGDEPFAQRLRDAGDRRLADRDDQGVDVAVLSLVSPGVQDLAATDSGSVRHREANDALAEIVAGHPERFQALAATPTPVPEAAVEELERAIMQLGFRGAMLYGRTGDRLADAPEFDDLYAAAERLRVAPACPPADPRAVGPGRVLLRVGRRRHGAGHRGAGRGRARGPAQRRLNQR
ncbi:amidohydrolase family protein [Streptomyces sp. 7N604]|uniref:amidohydrolase family protein n=1 Tax=Streptomyces sp. 7N604 TaxID=3457415 RepID=UPI003FCF8720